MKTIVISGACSNIGKTTLAKELCTILPKAEYVKIGTGRKKEHCSDRLYPFGSYFEQIRINHSKARFLIIESNHILIELEADLCIYLDGQPEKPSALLARQKADVLRGDRISEEKIRHLADGLGISSAKMKEICLLAGANPVPISAVILTGGESSRMGRNKVLLPIKGKTLVEHLYDILIGLFDEVIISVSGGKKESIFPNAPLVPDVVPGKGPLMGIYSGICASSHYINFVIACDIPVINVSLLRKLLSYSLEYDVVVPSFERGKYEPLFGIYTKKAATSAKELLDNDKRRVAELFSVCKTKILKTTDSNWYTNLNTPEDYKKFFEGVKEESK